MPYGHDAYPGSQEMATCIAESVTGSAPELSLPVGRPSFASPGVPGLVGG